LPRSPSARTIQVSHTSRSGVGIPAKNLTKIFGHGFTTRDDGHGFGLHSAALAAKEMGGTLLARSDGPGLGARFILTVPLAVDKQLEMKAIPVPEEAPCLVI
jgi:two-component system NtrC family sensor kinase